MQDKQQLHIYYRLAFGDIKPPSSGLQRLARELGRLQYKLNVKY